MLQHVVEYSLKNKECFGKYYNKCEELIKCVYKP